jgi:hypothetical protein
MDALSAMYEAEALAPRAVLAKLSAATPSRHVAASRPLRSRGRWAPRR